MSRSGYTDDWDDIAELNLSRGTVARTISGKRGQAFFVDLLAALDAMEPKVLVENELETDDGFVCALGALGRKRGIDVKSVDPEDAVTVAGLFGISETLAREVVYMNDEVFWRITPTERWERMRAWVAGNIKAKP